MYEQCPLVGVCLRMNVERLQSMLAMEIPYHQRRRAKEKIRGIKGSAFRSRANKTKRFHRVQRVYQDSNVRLGCSLGSSMDQGCPSQCVKISSKRNGP